jgi:hypothetical protein
MQDQQLQELLIASVGALASLLIAILVYLAKEVLNEMKTLNVKLVEIVKNQTLMGTNQEWHFGAIKELQKDVNELKENKRSDIRGCEI